MFPGLPVEKAIGENAKQVRFLTDTHECSITVFEPRNNTEDKDLATQKNYSRNDNDIVWLGNVRFSATNRI